MSNEVKFKYGTREQYDARLKAEGGVDSSALYFVTKTITAVDEEKQTSEVEFGGTIYRGNDAIGTTCADHLKTTEAIQITGGPLANNIAESSDVWPADWKVGNNKIIPAGASLQDILMKLFCKENFPSASTSQGSLSSSMSLTTISFNPTDTELEVGSLITTNALTANNSSCSETPAKISNLTNGYSLTEQGEKKTGTINFDLESVSESSNTHEISLTYSGFTETAPSTASGAGSATMPSQTLIVKEGECKVTANAKGSSYTAKSPKVTEYEYYNISNINTRKKETKSINEKSLSTRAQASSNDKVTGYYKYFMGCYNFTAIDTVENVFDSSIIRGLVLKSDKIVKDGTTTVVDANTTIETDGRSVVIAVPTKYKLATIKNDLGGSELSNFNKIGEVDVYNDTNKNYKTTYRVYVYPIAGGAKCIFKDITITKA